jgi:hypothetical protein
MGEEMVIARSMPPVVTQTLENSCWAAVLESWSRIDPRFTRQLSQDLLIDAFGEGDTGGITPISKIPIIAGSYDMRHDPVEARGLGTYLTHYLPTSHIFCAYAVRQYMHSLLIYRMSDIGQIRYMDPNGFELGTGMYRSNNLEWFIEHAPLYVMRKR